MRLYWLDREGNPPPKHCTFHFLPFLASEVQSSPVEFVDQLPPPLKVKALKKTYLPEKKDWEENVEKALKLISSQELEKIVLARSCTFVLQSAPDPFAILSSLQKKASGAFLFCMQWEGGAFLGASPERLFTRKGREISSEALAGTRARGKTESEDKALQKELLESPKDLREFLPVQKHLKKALSPLCEAPLEFSPISIHQTQNVQHLYSKCTGRLKESVTDEQILAALHPTPALCGHPQEKAKSFIEKLEPFQRGLYSGAIGWSTKDAAEWIVGIRACHLTNHQATLFSGTGIVEGSCPQKEWDELNEKLRLYDSILDD